MLNIARAQRVRFRSSGRLCDLRKSSLPASSANLQHASSHHRHRLPTALHRNFTQHSQRLLISRVPLRAELPYLHASSLRRAVLHGQQGFSQLSFRDRLFTLREVRTWRDFVFTAFQAVLLTTVGWTLYQCVSYARYEDGMESAHPTPHGWSFRSRSALRRALAAEDAVVEGTRVPDWVSVGRLFAQAIERLEDKTLEGADIAWSLGEGEEILVEGLGRTGLDIGGCSEEWRRGYFQALMGAGRAAERYDTTVRDKLSGSLFPAEFVVGPSNPDPRPLPLGIGGGPPPREENCEPAGPPPEKFYLKVLTTAGFATGQRLRAALAYADWLRYKGLNDAAHSMHTWALDIAIEGAAASAAASGYTGEDFTKLVDRETGVLSSRLQYATDNILLAAESMGSHFALAGDFSRALPAYLSVLRAQQTLPDAASSLSVPAALPSSATAGAGESPTLFERAWHNIYPPYPAPPPSGDTQSLRSPDTVCASATTMAHIGELLFASDLEVLSADLTSTNGSGSSNPLANRPGSSKALQPTRAQASGLAWTRQAADLAEATLKSLEAQATSKNPRQQSSALGSLASAASRARAGGSQVQERQKRCAECLQMAVNNWAKMVHRFEKAEREATGSGQQARSPKVIGSERLSEVQAVDREIAEERQMERTGWGLFWSEKLGFGGAQRGLAEQPSEGAWAAEGRMVRQRARAARVLGRQLGLD